MRRKAVLTKLLTVRFDHEVTRKLEAIAEREHRSLAQVVRLLVIKVLSE